MRRPTNVPFRSLASEIVRVGGREWKRLGDLLDRNFAEIEAKLSVESLTSSRVYTTDATVTTILEVAVPISTAVVVDVTVVARRTGGSSGTADDSAGYRRLGTFRNSGGTLTQVGSTSSPHTAENQAGWDVTLDTSGVLIRVRVTGAANNDIAWYAVARSISVNE